MKTRPETISAATSLFRLAQRMVPTNLPRAKRSGLPHNLLVIRIRRDGRPDDADRPGNEVAEADGDHADDECDDDHDDGTRDRGVEHAQRSEQNGQEDRQSDVLRRYHRCVVCAHFILSFWR